MIPLEGLPAILQAKGEVPITDLNPKSYKRESCCKISAFATPKCDMRYNFKRGPMNPRRRHQRTWCAETKKLKVKQSNPRRIGGLCTLQELQGVLPAAVRCCGNSSIQSYASPRSSNDLNIERMIWGCPKKRIRSPLLEGVDRKIPKRTLPSSSPPPAIHCSVIDWLSMLGNQRNPQQPALALRQASAVEVPHPSV